MTSFGELRERAKNLLLKNSYLNYTVPSKTYPFQWLWDSGFISIGYSTFNLKKAYSELISLMKYQTKDGFIPHMIFRKRVDYYPSPSLWGKNTKHSRITQVPVLGYALEKIVNKDKNLKYKKYALHLYKSIKIFHHYLLNKRDPEGMGLSSIIHPWESGMDNSPRWDIILDRLNINYIKKIEYMRSDILNYPPSQRPSKKRYDKFIFLVYLMRKNNFHLNKFYKAHPFKVKDIFFNSILYLSNSSLIRIGKLFDDDTSFLEDSNNKLHKGLRKLTKQSFSYDYDIVNEEIIKSDSISILSSFISRILKKDDLENIFKRFNEFRCYSLFTSQSKKSKYFSKTNYWRGPIWININWLVLKAFEEYRFEDESLKLRKAILNLVSKRGFFEYYSSCSLKGLGASKFSWSLALTLDLLKN